MERTFLIGAQIPEGAFGTDHRFKITCENLKHWLLLKRLSNKLIVYLVRPMFILVYLCNTLLQNTMSCF